MNIKKLDKNRIEIINKDYVFYILKEKNPGTKKDIGKQLYFYFLDIFQNKYNEYREVYDREIFNEIENCIDYIKNNYTLDNSIINKIKFK